MALLTFHLKVGPSDSFPMDVDCNTAVFASILWEDLRNEKGACPGLSVVRQAEVLILCDGLVVVEPRNVWHWAASNLATKLNLFSVHDLERHEPPGELGSLALHCLWHLQHLHTAGERSIKNGKKGYKYYIIGKSFILTK